METLASNSLKLFFPPVSDICIYAYSVSKEATGYLVYSLEMYAAFYLWQQQNNVVTIRRLIDERGSVKLEKSRLEKSFDRSRFDYILPAFS